MSYSARALAFFTEKQDRQVFLDYKNYESFLSKFMVLIKYDFPSCVLIINEEKIVFKNGHTNSLFPKLSAYKDFSHIFRKIYVNDIFPVDNFTEECASLEKDNSSSANRLNLDDIIRKRENDSKRNSEA